MYKIFLNVDHKGCDIKIKIQFFIKRISQKLYKASAYRKWGSLHNIIYKVTMSADNGLLRKYAGVFCIVLYVLLLKNLRKSYNLSI